MDEKKLLKAFATVLRAYLEEMQSAYAMDGRELEHHVESMLSRAKLEEEDLSTILLAVNFNAMLNERGR